MINHLVNPKSAPLPHAGADCFHSGIVLCRARKTLWGFPLLASLDRPDTEQSRSRSGTTPAFCACVGQVRSTWHTQDNKKYRFEGGEESNQAERAGRLRVPSACAPGHRGPSPTGPRGPGHFHRALSAALERNRSLRSLKGALVALRASSFHFGDSLPLGQSP